MGDSARVKRGWVPATTLPQHPLTRYLKVRLEVTDGVLKWQLPWALLGIIPWGTRHVTMPINEIGNITVRMALRPLRLIAGAIIAVVSLMLGIGWAAAPLVAFGVWVAAVSFGPQVELLTTGGATRRAPVCFAHRIDAEMYAAAVNALMVEALDEAETHVQTHATTHFGAGRGVEPRM